MLIYRYVVITVFSYILLLHENNTNVPTLIECVFSWTFKLILVYTYLLLVYYQMLNNKIIKSYKMVLYIFKINNFVVWEFLNK